MNNIALLKFNIILSLTYHHVRVFFKKHRGKKLSAKEKPRLTDEQKTQRKEWATKMLENIQDSDFSTAFWTKNGFTQALTGESSKSFLEGAMSLLGQPQWFVPRPVQEDIPAR